MKETTIPHRLALLALCFLGCLAALSCAKEEYWPGKDWRSAAPESQRMDPAILAEIDGFVTQELSDTTSILVVRNGYIVFEKYYGCDQARTHSLYSVTKTVISILVGSALKEGLIHSVDDKIENYLPEPLLSEMSEAARGITIRHLLNMTAGFVDDAVPRTRQSPWQALCVQWYRAEPPIHHHQTDQRQGGQRIRQGEVVQHLGYPRAALVGFLRVHQRRVWAVSYHA
jgi:CubicO group peptidase (beta-lactamase class C family)